MSAKEMFEKLGYNLKPTAKTRIRYEKVDELHIYHFIFSEKRRIFSKTCDFGKTHIEANELQAINKQIEELGWLDEKDS